MSRRPEQAPWALPASAPREGDAGQFYLGMVECVIAFGVALADRGLIGRAELARQFRVLVDQQRRNTTSIGSQAEFEARVAVAFSLAEFFEIPVSAGPRVIEGGKDAPPEVSR